MLSNLMDPEVEEADLDAQAPLTAAEYPEALLRWVGSPVSVYPRLRRGEFKGTPVSFRLPDVFERQLDIVVQRGREAGLPWQTRTDVIRDAVVWFSEILMGRLAAGDTTFEAMSHAHAIRDRVEFLTGLRKSAKDSVSSLSALLGELLAAGRIRDARTELSRFREGVRQMGKDSVIRQYYDEAIAGDSHLQTLIQALEEESK